MINENISRREMLKILFWGSAGVAVSGLSSFQLGHSSSSLTRNHHNIDPSSSTLRRGTAKVTIIQDGTGYLALSDVGSTICAGSDATDVIQEGLNKGLTTGRKYKETVELRGSFLNLKTILLPSFMTLDLSQAFLKQANATRNYLLTNKDKDNGGSMNIDILGGIVDGNKIGNAANFDDPLPGHDIMNTIHLENVMNCNINGISLINGYYHGLRIRNSSNIFVNYSTFKSVSRESVSISGQGKPLGSCKQIKVFCNTILDSGESAVSTLKASDVIILGNECDTIVGDASGITINGLNNHVVNNTIKNSHRDLISIAQRNLPDFDASGSIVNGNICQGARLSYGITLLGYGCKNLIINGNQVTGATEGVSVSASNQNILITNNIIHACRNSGIRVSGAEGFDIRNLKISNNMCYNNGTARDPDELNKAGIRINAKKVGLVHDCIIENNSCFDDRQEGRTQDYGIRLVNTKDCVVRFNYTKNNLIAGISEVDNVGTISQDNTGQI